jgi:hypothetical protein
MTSDNLILWNYTSKNDWENMSLHDCRIMKISILDTDTVFEFNDNGFWITETNNQNPYKRTLRTEKSQLTLTNCHCITLKITERQWLLSKFLRNKKVHIPWLDLCSKINANEYQFEFINEIHQKGLVRYEGILHSNNEPYSLNCQLKFRFDEMVYGWNKIDENKPW